VDSKPGPGAYNPSVTPTTSRKAAFSIRARPQAVSQGSFSPGPGQYGSGPSKPHVGLAPNAPCYTFGLKTLTDKEADRKPGPAGMCLLSLLSQIQILHVLSVCGALAADLWLVLRCMTFARVQIDLGSVCQFSQKHNCNCWQAMQAASHQMKFLWFMSWSSITAHQHQTISAHALHSLKP